jgi:hypothetical protein
MPTTDACGNVVTELALPQCRRPTVSGRGSNVSYVTLPTDRLEPWIFARATRQRGRVATAELPYDDARQVTMIESDGERVPAVERFPPPQTKKGDIEKGEDQKDRW